jgi:hypothetical protein
MKEEKEEARLRTHTLGSVRIAQTTNNRLKPFTQLPKLPETPNLMELIGLNPNISIF